MSLSTSAQIGFDRQVQGLFVDYLPTKRQVSECILVKVP